MTPTATLLSSAWHHHQAGNLPQAEDLYRQVLTAEPGNVSALQLLALVCQVQGRVAESIALYQRALQAQPDHAEVRSNLGVAYASLGRMTEAIACYREAVRLKPDYPEALNNLGYLTASQGDWDQAIASYRRALALRPEYPEALSNLGIALFQTQQADEARRCFQQALALRPQYPEVLKNLGNVHLAEARLGEAADCYRQALRLRPNDPQTSNNLAGACRGLGQWEEAVACLQHSLKYKPDDPITFRNLANVYYDQGKHSEALTCYRQLLALAPTDVEAQFLIEGLSGTSSLARAPADFIATLYDALAPGFERDLVERLRYTSPSLLKAALGPAPPSRSLAVLDLGCGTGLCGLEFRDWASTLVGVDLSPRMLAQARERGIYNELITGDLLATVQQSENRFDLVLASDVLLYFGDLGPVAQAVHRALRPGGRFAFTLDVVEGADYRLSPFACFAHSRAYIQNVAAQAQLRELCVNEVRFPRTGGESAAGVVLVWSRGGAR